MVLNIIYKLCILSLTSDKYLQYVGLCTPSRLRAGCSLGVGDTICPGSITGYHTWCETVTECLLTRLMLIKMHVHGMYIYIYSHLHPDTPLTNSLQVRLFNFVAQQQSHFISCFWISVPHQTRHFHFETCNRPEDNTDWEAHLVHLESMRTRCFRYFRKTRSPFHNLFVVNNF